MATYARMAGVGVLVGQPVMETLGDGRVVFRWSVEVDEDLQPGEIVIAALY